MLFMPESVYGFRGSVKFLLVAVNTLVGALMRIPYTVGVGVFDGREFTVATTLVLLVPTAGTLWLLANPGLPLAAYLVCAGADWARRRQLLGVDDQHQRVLTAAAQRLGAGTQCRRRQHRRVGDSVGRPAGYRRRRSPATVLGLGAVHGVADGNQYRCVVADERHQRLPRRSRLFAGDAGPGSYVAALVVCILAASARLSGFRSR